jgi:hypothetical protein
LPDALMRTWLDQHQGPPVRFRTWRWLGTKIQRP